NKKVKMPNFPIMVTGIFVNDDSEVLFDSKSKLLMKPTEKGRYRIIGVHGVENVKIFSPVIVGDRRSHLGDSGEWGDGIEVKPSKNIQIHDPYITECWGDGIIITESTSNMRTGKKGGKVENILVKGGTLDYSRRNGVTVTAGQDINLEGINVANTMGT